MADQLIANATGTSLYVHVPFCVVKCGYCDFNSYVVDDTAAHDRFLAALDAELQRTWSGRPPVSVFFGGGTPSLLSEQRLERLFAIVDGRVGLQGGVEVSMEANPESLTVDKARLAKAAGVTRLSVGVQSFHAHHLQFLDRAHDADAARRAVAAGREAGFENISIDLMFGIPGETADEWRSDLEQALLLRCDHLSCYNLTFEPGTKLHHRREQGAVEQNEQDLDRAMFEHTRSRLEAAGFEAYEVSNFAGRGGPCRHNDHYWLQGNYVGVGPGASSHRDGVRSTNLKPLQQWADAALHGPCSAASAETLTPLQRAAEALWLGIRRRDGVDVVAVERRTGVAVRSVFDGVFADQRDRGLVAYDGNRLSLVGEGLLFADQVGGDYLEVSAADE